MGLAEQDGDGGSENKGGTGGKEPEGWRVEAQLMSQKTKVEPEG